MLRQVQGELSKEGWQQVREGIEVQGDRLSEIRPNAGTLPQRGAGEQRAGMLEKFAARMEKGLQAMKKSAEKGRLKSLVTAYVRLGRLQDQNWRQRVL